MKISGEDEVPNKNAKIADIKIDTSIVAKRSVLSLIKGYHHYQESLNPSWHEAQKTLYPLANFYYTCNTDTDPTERIADIIENSSAQQNFKSPTSDPYSEQEARTKYLNSKPVCYIIFGKPGLETERLAELIAASRDCVLISASKILREYEERDDESAFRRDELQCGCDSTEDIVWTCIVNRVHERTVSHRGYVIEGLPLLKNIKNLDKPNVSSTLSGTDETCMETVKPSEYVTVKMLDSDVTEESSSTETPESNTDSNVSSIEACPEKFGSQTSVCTLLRKRSELLKHLSANASIDNTLICACSVDGSDGSKCEKCRPPFQLNQVFNEWKLKPDIIINITCPDDEILSKYKNSDSDIFSSTENVDKALDTSSEITDEISCRSITKLFKNANYCDKSKFSQINLKYDLCNYSQYVLKSIEKVICNHNPQNVICLDGRYPIDHLIEVIKIRLQILPLQNVILPERLVQAMDNFNSSDEGEEENEADESEEYENDSFENFDNDNLNLRRAFDKIKRSGIVSENFEWKLSRWKFLCPVELAKGKKIEGKKKLAVRFMNWLFFLSSNEAMEDFIENPRPYLLPPNPRPCCRIVVIGPRYSGRTKLSFDLAKNLDSPVINVRDIIMGLHLNSDSIDTPIDLEINDLMKSSRFSNSEIVNAIAENVENLPEQNCWDYFRNKGWILDNICLDYELCKKLLENDINVDTVVIIYESEPYSKLINHWKLLHEEKSYKSEKEEMSEFKFDDFSDEYHEEVGELGKYIEELRYFNNNAEYVGNKLKDIGLDVVFCDLKFIDDLSDHAISHIWRDYQFEAKISEQDESEESVEEESQTTLSETALCSSQEKKYRLGDCYTYCPVALLEHDVLWKGKHRCLLDDKFYFLSNESTLNRFLTNHWKLPLPFQNPPRKIPSLKIIIVGPPGSGKSTLANLISKEYGLTHVDFSKCLEEYLRCRGIDVEQLKSRLAYEDHEQENYSEDSLEEVELPEDLHDLKYNVDKSTIINFFLKYKREGTPLPECIVKECFLNYFRAPFNNTGLVFNSFPNYVEEIEIILKHFAVPDVIIELQCNYHNSEKRLLKLLLAKWQTTQDKKRREENAKFSEEMENYHKKKRKWMNRERRRRYRCKKLDLDEYECDALEQSSTETSESSDFSGNLDFSESLLSLDADEEMELEETFIELFPMPELYQYWESEEPVKEKVSMQIEEDYDKAKLNLSLIYNIFKGHNIPWIEIDANVNAHHVFLKALHILTPYARRNLSFFEKTYEIDNTTAESLLESGYYFLSSFGRFCPVQVYKRKNPFQMFLPLTSQDKIFAVLHRQYVYFLAGKEALDEFKQQPLKYLNQDPQIPMIPAIISIIGPPKCGKTTLSNRFSSTYGFEVISRDEALNYVLNNFPWMNLSSSVRKKFHNGEPASPDQLAAVVKLFLSNSQCVTQGCVFDGFPSTVEESQALTSLAINPVIVIDLQAPLLFTIECLENNETQTCVCLSHQEQYEEWKSDAEVFRAWLGNRLANIVKVDATISKAGVWYKSDEHVRLRFSKFVRYIRCAGYDKVHDLECLCITPNEIQCRLSCCKLFCPACFYFKKIFNAADLSKTRKGLVQFREYFYWYCEQHIRLFKCHPQRYLYLFKNLKWPNQYPQLIADEVDLQNYCWASRLANDGYCIVTYIENLPARKLIPGKPNLSLIYLNRIYLFTTPIQRDKFTRDFPRYSSLRINFPRKLEPLVIKELPTLGFLEQSLAAYIVKAVNRVGESRPKLPGMSSSTSAAVFIGAYLKTCNKTKESKLYIAAMERMLKRCNIMHDAIESMKKVVNPWITIEEEEKVVKVSNISAHRRSSVGFLHTSTVKFRRTSPTQLLMESDESISDF